jgi:hypothetical protein
MSTQPKCRYLRDLPKEERKQLVLSGQTTAGPLTVLMYKYPIGFWTVAIIVGHILFYGIWLLVNSAK